MSQNKPTPESPELNDQIMNKLRWNRRWLRVLTIMAVCLWLIATLGGAAVLWSYRYLYLPKQKQYLHETQQLYDYHRPPPGEFREVDPGIVPQRKDRPPPDLTIEHAAAIQATMSHFLGVGVVGVAFSVILLSLGTLVTLVLVGLNRRVTLRQINASLAQISGQIKELQHGKAAGPTASD